MLSIRLQEEDYEAIIECRVTVVDLDDDEVTVELDSDEAWLLSTEGMIETTCRETSRELMLLTPDDDED